MRKPMLAALVLVLAGTCSWGQAPVPVSTTSVAPAGCSSCAAHPVVLVDGGCCDACSAGPRWSVGAEYLYWWVSKGPQSFPLVTTGDPADAPPGALGQPGTAVLYGGNGFQYGTFSGLRVNLAGWLNSGWGVELGGFLLERRSDSFAAGSDGAGNPPLYVPLFNTATGAEGSFTIADPVFGFAGNLAIASQLRLWGYEANLLRGVIRDDACSVDLMVGLRYLQLAESIQMDAFSDDFLADIQSTFTDQFSTRNSFAGGQFGARVARTWGPVNLEFLARVALGNNHQNVSVRGQTNSSGTGLVAPTVTPGGILTAPTSIGTTTRNDFCVIPQVGLKIGWDLTANVRATVGYDLLYWGEVVRPGNTIDRVINPSQQFGGVLVGPPSPQRLTGESDFYAHGVSFGLDLRY